MNLEKWGPSRGGHFYNLLHSVCHREGQSEVMKRELEPRAAGEIWVYSLPLAVSMTSGKPPRASWGKVLSSVTQRYSDLVGANKWHKWNKNTVRLRGLMQFSQFWIHILKLYCSTYTPLPSKQHLRQIVSDQRAPEKPWKELPGLAGSAFPPALPSLTWKISYHLWLRVPSSVKLHFCRGDGLLSLIFVRIIMKYLEQ